MRFALLTTLSIGLLTAACQTPYQQSARVPPPAGPQVAVGVYSSEQTCSDYGFSSNTAAFDRCVQHQRAARSTGRVNRDYTQAMLTNDARSACASYGLDIGSARFDNCVGREIDARGYRESANQPAPTYRTDQYGNRIGPDGYRVSQTTPMYRTDQYGNRIDSEGYRVDANGYRMPR
jgi:hypothetical protein